MKSTGPKVGMEKLNSQNEISPEMDFPCSAENFEYPNFSPLARCALGDRNATGF